MNPITDRCKCSKLEPQQIERGIKPCKCHTKAFKKKAKSDCVCDTDTLCYCCAHVDRTAGSAGHIKCMACGRHWTRPEEKGWKPIDQPVVTPQGNRPPPKPYEYWKKKKR